jgi:nucleoside-diphosphate kinase
MYLDAFHLNKVSYRRLLMEKRERTFIMVKPDGVQRGLIGNIIGRMENKGLKLVAMKMMQINPDLAAKHYGEHQGKPFYAGLIEFITSAPVVAMIWEGDNVVDIARAIIGATDPRKASPGTIRGDLAVFTGKNIVHGSDSQASAERELALFFNEQELCSYLMPCDSCLYD